MNVRAILPCLALSLALVPACVADAADGDATTTTSTTPPPASEACPMPAGVGPGPVATDARAPELTDLAVLDQAKLSLSEALAETEARYGAAIEAKFEPDDDGHLSLSVYDLGGPATLDSERSTFREFAADPTIAPLAGDVAPFDDEAHLLRSARELTIVQLSGRGLRDVVAEAEHDGQVFWAVPTIQGGKPGYGIYVRAPGCVVRYRFVDGTTSQVRRVSDLGDGPGPEATDARVPELGADLAILRSAKVTLADGIAYAAAHFGAPIEAKFELGDDGQLSLSVYPLAADARLDAERNHFGELAGDPTAATWSPTLETFALPDREHLTRSARDLTIVQTASLDLAGAVAAAQAASPGGIVFWAVPTIRTERAGYGVYVYAADGTVHCFFVS